MPKVSRGELLAGHGAGYGFGAGSGWGYGGSGWGLGYGSGRRPNMLPIFKVLDAESNGADQGSGWGQWLWSSP